MSFTLLNIKKAPVWGFFIACVFSLSLHAKEAGIASAHPLATQAGLAVLQQGGNAFDAAVTVSAVLAVVEPFSSGMGGGGFWLLHQADNQRDVMVDGRERAPLVASRDMYLDKQGLVVKGLSVNGALSAGIPGQPAALVHIAENYGSLPLKQLLQPAIDIARKGFIIDAHYLAMATWRTEVLQRYPASSVFLDEGFLPESGWRLKQPNLATTLEKIAEHGAKGFYQGDVAKELVSSVKAAGGIWSLKDLQQYKVIERQPERVQWGDWKITMASLPSSGGIVLSQILHMLEAKNYKGIPADSIDRVTLLIESMRRAYQDRAEYMGDPDYVLIPGFLTDAAYAGRKIADYNPQRATPSQAGTKIKEGNDTTHFSIIDAKGNRVSATLSINYPFGSCFVAGNTGVLLNDEMDDFSAKPGTPNVYGLVGNEANAIEPGKRMLSSMTPTFVETVDGVAVIGTPGGSRIITMVLLAMMEMYNGKPPQQWVSRKRFHHQYLPDLVQYEKDAFTEIQIKQLKQKNYLLQEQSGDYGNMQVLFLDKQGHVSGASDPRGIGQSGFVRMQN